MSGKRFSTYLEQRADLDRAAGIIKCDPIRLTPGQYATLCQEQGYSPITTFNTSQGPHEVQLIECHVRATGDNVLMCPREDLFQETDRGVGIELVSTANSVTSVPDNIGCVEVLSVGPLAAGVQVGEIVFIDFFRVKQGYVVANEEIYAANSDSLAAKYDPETQQILPLDNTVICKAAPKRFSIALNGTDRIIAPDTVTTDGIVSGRTSKGSDAARSVYGEVVRVGKLTARPSGCAMTPLERKVLDVIAGPGALAHTQYDSIDDVEATLFNALIEERKTGRESDLHGGELVTFCVDIATRVRCRGEYQWIVPYDSCLAVIDDEGILEDSIKRNEAGIIIRGR